MKLALTGLVLMAILAAACGDSDDECSGASMRGGSCTSLGYDHGTLQCTAEGTFNTALCATCDDGIRNGDEAGIDCGVEWNGKLICKACPNGTMCTKSIECASGNCGTAPAGVARYCE